MNKENDIDEEIDLIALAKILWGGRKKIIKITLIFIAIGLFVAIFSEKEYTASTTFITQTSNNKIGGNLGGLAAMAGINLGSMSGSDSGISPALYPQILSSIPFQKELLQVPLMVEGQNKKNTLEEYYTKIYKLGLLGYLKKYSIGLPEVLISIIKGKPNDNIKGKIEKLDLVLISREEQKLIEKLTKQIILEVNDKEGYVTISASMPEAVSSAELTNAIKELLQKYIIDFKVKKSKEQLKFVEDRYIEKEKEFRTVQQKLARYRDRNRNMNSSVAETKLQNIQSEYDIAFSVFNELAKQLETNKIQVKENTPVFMVLKPATIPIEKTNPKRALILIIYTFLGLIIGAGFIIVKLVLKNTTKLWKQKY